eukprot:TRINITY_DN7025_c0_g1_i1.p1 TRINITY_DN7025_c0_g1~~TRINITY_DN7025_c0_g1_i1.p1  ORF type:complete len:141 (+),score=17.30 TRINITY_DN7025_c0_g1_i1:134-556(+)
MFREIFKRHPPTQPKQIVCYHSPTCHSPMCVSFVIVNNCTSSPSTLFLSFPHTKRLYSSFPSPPSSLNKTPPSAIGSLARASSLFDTHCPETQSSSSLPSFGTIHQSPNVLYGHQNDINTTRITGEKTTFLLDFQRKSTC